jgi:DNA gyrase/topoisomerase IV subunit A
MLADLFKYTPLEDTFSVIMLALVDGEPRTLSLKQAFAGVSRPSATISASP